MKHTEFYRRTLISISSVLLIFTLGGQSILLAVGDKTKIAQPAKAKTETIKEIAENAAAETSILPAPTFDLIGGIKTSANVVPQVGMYLGDESEPNGTPATADVLTGSEVKIRGNIQPNGDQDYFSFTANAGDKIYAAIMTSFSSSGSTDSILTIFASDGTTVLETDDNDGSLGASSSTIAGVTIPSNGTYYARVNHFSATSPPV